MTEITRETIEEMLAWANVVLACNPQDKKSQHLAALARSWLDKDAIVEDVEWSLSSEPCLPHKTALGLKLHAVLARLDSAEARLSALSKDAMTCAETVREMCGSDECAHACCAAARRILALTAPTPEPEQHADAIERYREEA